MPSLPPGQRAPAVGREVHAQDDAGVALEGEQVFSGFDFPDVGLAVVAAGDDEPAVAGDGEPLD